MSIFIYCNPPNALRSKDVYKRQIVPGADGLLLFLDFGLVEIGDLALDGLDGVDLIHRLHMDCLLYTSLSAGYTATVCSV